MQPLTDDRVLRALAELTPAGYGGIRRVACVEDVARKLYGLEPEEMVPGTRNSHVAMQLKRAREQGLCEYGTKAREVNLGYHVTVAGERYLGIAPPESRVRRALRRSGGRRRVR